MSVVLPGLAAALRNFIYHVFFPKQHFSPFSSQDVDGFLFLLGPLPVDESLGLPPSQRSPACLDILSWASGARGWVPSAVHLLCECLFSSVHVHWRATLGGSRLGLENIAMEMFDTWLHGACRPMRDTSGTLKITYKTERDMIKLEGLFLKNSEIIYP